MREGAAHERGVEHAREAQVVDVAAPSRQDAGVLDPGDPLADEPFHYFSSGRSWFSSDRSSAARRTPSTIDW